ncbi:MAG: hypothetical protein Q9224_003069 [Gallowayella concinna]
MVPKHGNVVSIKDIRRDRSGVSILDEIHTGLRPRDGGEKKMPTMLLYDEQGLKLFEDITYLNEYYLTNAEIEVLQRYATAIATSIPEGCAIVELGSGNLRKVSILLDALELEGKRADYYALDLSEPELRRTLSAVPQRYEYVSCHGLLGTYDDGLEWLKRSDRQQRPTWILSLGSSIGNFGREEAVAFLQGFAATLGGNDRMLVGLDACQDAQKVYRAYNDMRGKTHEFVLNGLLHANRLLSKEAFKLQDWTVIGEFDEAAGRHQAFYSPNKSLVIDGVYLEAGEKIRVEESYKYTTVQRNELWHKVGLVQQVCFGNKTDDYHLHVLAKPVSVLPKRPEEYATQPVPSLDEFKQLWAKWDIVTQHMIPKDQLLSKPILLRNCCLFYLGHIPTFLDIHLTRATGQGPTEPSSYQMIFERGIDPDVDNPEHCHAHSEIPETWPPVTDIIDYQGRVRSRVEQLFNMGTKSMSQAVGRALWLGFEHEALHLETLLYMLLQSDSLLPPPGSVPDFETLAHDARNYGVHNEWIKIPAATVSVGMQDPETDSGPVRYFGWDNEKPMRKTHVPAFKAQARPLTNEDFARYLCGTNQQALPASWTQTGSGGGNARATKGSAQYADANRASGPSEPLHEGFLDGKCVRTVYGPIALQHALAWPVFASYDELAGCAQWMNGRIPTADEVRSIYNHVNLAKKEAEKVQAKKISAVNGHLSNDGVEETPPSAPAINGSSGAGSRPNPQDLFVDLEDCNVGFSHFHPTPMTQFGNKLCGRGEMGGVWEWTSSRLEEHGGFEAMPTYPGYTDQRGEPMKFQILNSSTAPTSSDHHKLRLPNSKKETIDHLVTMGFANQKILPRPCEYHLTGFTLAISTRHSDIHPDGRPQQQPRGKRRTRHLRRTSTLSETLAAFCLLYNALHTTSIPERFKATIVPNIQTRSQSHTISNFKAKPTTFYAIFPKASNILFKKEPSGNATRLTVQMGEEQRLRCRKSAELHDKRHREIAALLLEIENIDRVDEVVPSPIPNGKRKSRRSDVLDSFLAPQILKPIGEEDEWADTSTLNNDDDLDMKRPGILGMQDDCPPRRTKKAQKKRAKHSSLVQIVTPALMDRIRTALHPEAYRPEDRIDKPGDANSTALNHRIIQENIAFNTNCFSSASMRQTVHAKKLLKSNSVGQASSKAAQDEMEMILILERLGITPDSVTASKQRSSLLKQLRSVIKDDIDRVENENRDTMMRMAGYWRYVNRKTYNYMVRENKIWDWTTGQKLEEIEEEEESEPDTGYDRETDNTVWDDASTIGTPRSGAGTPQKEVEDYTGDYQLDEKSHQMVEDMGATDARPKNPTQELHGRKVTQASVPQPHQPTFDVPLPKQQDTSGRPDSRFLPYGKDSRHFVQPTAIATHKYEEPRPANPPHPTPSISQPPAKDGDSFSTTHRDPNNRYHSLANPKSGLNESRGCTNSTKALKLVLPKATSPKKTTGAWTTIKGKSPGLGKATYAGAVKKKT